MLLTILDRYIIRKYLATFSFTVLIFSLLILVIDFSEKIDDFMSSKVSVRAVIFDYYVNNIPYFNGLLFPLYSLIAVIFFTSRMAYNSEIISILNSGTSFSRLMRPYLIAATLLFGVHLWLNHFFLPKGNKTLVAFDNQYITKIDRESQQHNIHRFIDSTTKIYFGNFNVYNKSGNEFTLETFRNGNQLTRRLYAQRAEWDSTAQHWKLYNYLDRRINGLQEQVRRGAMLDTTLSLRAADLERRTNLRTTMTSPELRAFLEREKQQSAGKYNIYEVELHRRTAEPFTIILLTIIGMTIASRKMRGGIGLHLAIGAGLGSMFIFLTKFSTTFSTNASLSPLLGVWIPNFIFMAVCVILIRTAQK